MKNLDLDRPLVFIDLETTGLNPFVDRIVELTLLKISPNGSEESRTKLVNPEMPIPEEATAVNGITDDDVADKPIFKQYANGLNEFLSDCDISGFNIKRFDLRFLETEFKRVGVEFSRLGRCIIDTMTIYHSFDPRDLKAAYMKYCGKKLENYHTSDADVKASAEILDAQLAIHNEIPKHVTGLHELCCEQGESDWVDPEGRFVLVDGGIIFNFGKHKGKPLKEIAQTAPDYLDWILHKPDFSLEVHEIILGILDSD